MINGKTRIMIIVLSKADEMSVYVLIRYRSNDMIARAVEYLNMRTFILIGVTLSLQSKKMMRKILKYPERHQQPGALSLFKIFCAFKNRS